MCISSDTRKKDRQADYCDSNVFTFHELHLLCLVKERLLIKMGEIKLGINKWG